MIRSATLPFKIMFLICLTSCWLIASETALPSQAGPYDETADARMDIREAVKRAKTDSQHVLLIFGANWCVWCRALHRLMKSDSTIYNYVKENYQVVFVNIGRKDKNMDVNERYGNPIRWGVPVLVFLDENGNYLATEETGQLEWKNSEQKGHDPQKVLAILKKWVHPAHVQK